MIFALFHSNHPHLKYSGSFANASNKVNAALLQLRTEEKNMFFSILPSGKLLHNYGTSPFFNGNTSCKLPFSIAISNYQRIFMDIWVYCTTILRQVHMRHMTHGRIPSMPMRSYRQMRRVISINNSLVGHRDLWPIRM